MPPAAPRCADRIRNNVGLYRRDDIPTIALAVSIIWIPVYARIGRVTTRHFSLKPPNSRLPSATSHLQDIAGILVPAGVDVAGE